MSNVNHKSTRSGTEPTSAADSAAIIRKRKDPQSPRQATNALLPTTARPPPAPIRILTLLPLQTPGLSVFGYLESQRKEDDLLGALQTIDPVKSHDYRSILRVVVPRRRPWIQPNISRVSGRMNTPINTSSQLGNNLDVATGDTLTLSVQ